jgi:hypothetical protein
MPHKRKPRSVRKALKAAVSAAAEKKELEAKLVAQSKSENAGKESTWAANDMALDWKTAQAMVCAALAEYNSYFIDGTMELVGEKENSEPTQLKIQMNNDEWLIVSLTTPLLFQDYKASVFMQLSHHFALK